MKQDIIIVGAGGHAKVLIDTLLQIDQFNILGLVVKNYLPPMPNILGYKILGDDTVLNAYPPHSVKLINAVGMPNGGNHRFLIYEALVRNGYQFATIQHPTAYVSPYVQLNHGVQVMAGVSVQPATNIAENVIINTNASIDHDVEIGAHSHIAPGAIILGGVKIEAHCFIGAGAIILPNLTIGAHCVVAAGAVVIHDLVDHSKVVGVPAVKIKDKDMV